MAWQVHTLIYEARSPVLLGTHPLGFVQRTRLYAPGWTLWGAITTNLTRATLDPASPSDYRAVGDFVAQNVLTSYAYILVDGQPASPHWKKDRLQYGTLPSWQFEARFLASLGQTGVAPATATAETGALHETEVLVAHDPHTGDRVRWQLTLYLRQPWGDVPQRLHNWQPKDVLEALNTLTIGADRHYGLGRLSRISPDDAVRTIEEDWPTPLDWEAKNRVLRAHVALENLDGNGVRGQVEAVPWRWWQNEPEEGREGWGPGQRHEVRCMYVPGCVVQDEQWQPAVGPYGLWRGVECGDDNPASR